VTAELALALPAVLLVLVTVLLTVSVGLTQLRCQDAARAGARVAALGVPDADVVAAAQHVGGGGTAVTVVREHPWVTVTVTAAVGAGRLGETFRLDATATAWVEP
jgi:hypothetical protein